MKNVKEICRICGENIVNGACIINIHHSNDGSFFKESNDIVCPIHPKSGTFNKFTGHCKWCVSQMHPGMKYENKRETVAIVRKFTGSTDPSPIFEFRFVKNVKMGEKLEMDTASDPLIIYRHKK